MNSISAPYLLALGDSLTAGHGLAPSASFAARLEALLRTRWPGSEVFNAGVSGDTTEGALRRLPRVLASLARKPDLAIVELGPNDVLRGIPPERGLANLDSILIELGRCGIPALLATFEAPPFLGPLAQRYDAIFATLAKKHDVMTAPFFPAGVFGHPELVLADRVHPNQRAIELVVDAFLPAVLHALGKTRVDAA